jgi:hypothetical protein
MAVLFLLLAFLVVVVLAAVGLENTDPSTATLFDRSFGQLTEGQLLLVAAGLGFLLALLLFLAFGASRTRRARRKELRSRRRDAEGRVGELERENARLEKDLASAREQLDDRDRAGATADRTAAPVDRSGATGLDDRVRTDERVAAPPQPASVRRERLDDRTGAPPVRDEHARTAEEARRR